LVALATEALLAVDLAGLVATPLAGFVALTGFVALAGFGVLAGFVALAAGFFVGAFALLALGGALRAPAAPRALPLAAGLRTVAFAFLAGCFFAGFRAGRAAGFFAAFAIVRFLLLWWIADASCAPETTAGPSYSSRVAAARGLAEETAYPLGKPESAPGSATSRR
jgi:hypothetical protein